MRSALAWLLVAALAVLCLCVESGAFRLFLAEQPLAGLSDEDNAGFLRPAVFGGAQAAGTRRLIQPPPLKRALGPLLPLDAH